MKAISCINQELVSQHLFSFMSGNLKKPPILGVENIKSELSDNLIRGCIVLKHSITVSAISKSTSSFMK